MLPVYATVEQISRSLEVANSSYSRSLILAKLNAASRGIEDLCHRRFYPERRTIRVDWPNYTYSAPWRLDLNGNEIISLEALTNGDGTDITADAFLRRGDDLAEPPYSSIEMNIGTSGAFTSGSTFQRAVSVLGIFGDRETSTATPAALVGSGGITDSALTLTIAATNGALDIGTGSLLLCGTERMLVILRRMADTSVNTSSSLLDLQSAQSVTVTDGTAFAYDETILIDAERMKINDISGNTLIVTRAWDGTTLAAHSSSADIYALRSLTVIRSVLGSTAASHSAADPIYAHEFPGPVNELCVAETVVMLEQNSSGYARTIGTGTREIETVGQGLADARARCITSCGRVSRSGAI